MSTKPNQEAFYRTCINPACKQPVHVRANQCKSCGATSPWKIDGLVVENRPYIVTRDFSCMIGISLRAFTEGEVLNDPALITTLIDEECPVREKFETDHMMVCPHCNRPSLVKNDEADPMFTAETAKKIARLGLG